MSTFNAIVATEAGPATPKQLTDADAFGRENSRQLVRPSVDLAPREHAFGSVTRDHDERPGVGILVGELADALPERDPFEHLVGHKR